MTKMAVWLRETRCAGFDMLVPGSLRAIAGKPAEGGISAGGIKAASPVTAAN